MSELTIHTSTPLSLPEPRVAIATRLATMDDLGWIDQLQKQHSKQLGFFPRAQMTGYIERGWILVAEATKDEGGRMKDENGGTSPSSPFSSFSLHPSSLPLGYIAYRDRYLKRDELGAVFQLCVRKDLQRGYIGAALLKAAFERSAYGCRLFCCWCAQDLAANRFWEAMGFVPLAFRTGSKTKKKGGRVHIFWQKRIRAGDVSTPWWFPSETGGGAVREDRIVLPIPPGVGWEEVRPVEVGPNAAGGMQNEDCGTKAKRLPGPARNPRSAVRTPRNNIATGGLRFAPAESVTEPKAKSPKVKPQKVKLKTDPKVAAAARELRDRWMEQINQDTTKAIGCGKYDVARDLRDPAAPLLPAA